MHALASPQLACWVRRLQQVPGLLEQCGVCISSAHSMRAETRPTLETKWGRGGEEHRPTLQVHQEIC